MFCAFSPGFLGEKKENLFEQDILKEGKSFVGKILFSSFNNGNVHFCGSTFNPPDNTFLYLKMKEDKSAQQTQKMIICLPEHIPAQREGE